MTGIRPAILVMAFALAAPALAQTTLEVAPDAPFPHERTGIALPAQLGTALRWRVKDYGEDQYDVAAPYESADKAVIITLYVYRAGLADVSVAADVVTDTIIRREGFTPYEAGAPSLEPFTAAGNTPDSAMRLAYVTGSGGRFRTAGMALVPHGEWLVKVRVSSNTHATGELRAFFDEIIAQLALPAPAFLAPPARPIAPCTTELATHEASLIQPDRAMIMTSALAFDGTSTAHDTDGAPVVLPGPRWCRDQVFTDRLVYRADQSIGAYAIVLDDAGNAVLVGGGADLLSALAQQNTAAIPAVHAPASGNALLGFLDGLPAPADALRQIDGVPPLARSDRAGDIEITWSEP